MNIILSDAGLHKRFLPLSYTRAIADFRVGILTIKEKWEKFLNSEVSVLTENYLQEKYNLKINSKNIIVNASVIPDEALIKEITELDKPALVKEDTVICFACGKNIDVDFNVIPAEYKKYTSEIKILKYLPSIFLMNDAEIKADFKLITKERKSQKLSNTNIVIGSTDEIFLEEGSFVEACTLNTTGGPVYIGKNSQLMEGTNIRGAFALCEDSIVKMGAKIYGATTIGPGSKVGGEINNSVFFANSNKAHDGFLGNSVIGEWCNLGADTNNSNLKNNYSNVKIWNYEKEEFSDTKLQFCGLFMGDHSKSGINTMFNTGTVVGFSANIFGAGFPRNVIPSFSWGGHAGIKEYKIDKALETIQKVIERRNLKLSDTDIKIINHIYKICSGNKMK